MRIALIGLGDIAQKAYLPLLAADARVTPLLCTRHPETLAHLGRQYRIPELFTDLDALLAARPDAVMIHAATSAHSELARATLGAGIPTFVDKPLCDSADQAERLCELALARNCPLFVGFNRRYLPAMEAARRQPLTELHWHKHRHALPGLAREFIFDDFIHVLDALCHFGGVPQGEVHTVLRASSRDPHLLAAVSVGWESDGRAIGGSMNRSAGVTEERISAYGEDLSLHLESCTRGTLARDGVVQRLEPGDWQPVLAQRGFAPMLEHWYHQIGAGVADSGLIDSYLHSHRLAERLVVRAEHLHTPC